MKMKELERKTIISHEPEEALEALGVAREKGLGQDEVVSRLKEYGKNVLREIKKRSAWEILLNQFKSLVVLLLVAASGVAFAFQEWIEGIAIAAVIFINALIGFVTEIRAVRSMEALRRMGSVKARVKRDATVSEVPAEQLVPGDIVVIEGGDIVTADLRVIEASKLEADESPLTGESVPVSKQVEPIEPEATIAEQANMLFKGTSVTRGSGEGVVVATGMNTELGQISTLVEKAEEEVTPLEKRLDQLGRRLIGVTLGIAAIVAISGILAGKEIFLMIETGIALAVASIPEGLPIVATIALARGMWRMAKRNALINRLSSVETLGSTNVICTDKTGTLTENEMTVTRIAIEDVEINVKKKKNEKSPFFINGKPVKNEENETLNEILKVGVLCNNASLQEESEKEEAKAVGDPTEVALLRVAARAGIHKDELVRKMPEAREEAFDSETKMMATYNEEDDGYYVAVKGAPESVLDACTTMLEEGKERELNEEDKERWIDKNERMADEGLRMMAFARKRVSSVDEQPYQNLTFLGLYGLMDPPREDVRTAVDSCQDAGIKVVMVTGDQPLTARAIALGVGLVDDPEAAVIHGRDLKKPQDMTDEEREHILDAAIFARVNPRQKLDLIEVHQGEGSIVAMTGDGVNDAPALKKADIGIAMGLRGTQVAREASDMVLKDDAFPTIIAAVQQGRIIFNNIRKFVLYLMSCNVSEIFVVFLASLINAPLPILPLQILFLNFVTDVFPALALGVGEGDPAVMKKHPRDAMCKVNLKNTIKCIFLG